MGDRLPFQTGFGDREDAAVIISPYGCEFIITGEIETHTPDITFVCYVQGGYFEGTGASNLRAKAMAFSDDRPVFSHRRNTGFLPAMPPNPQQQQLQARSRSMGSRELDCCQKGKIDAALEPRSAVGKTGILSP